MDEGEIRFLQHVQDSKQGRMIVNRTTGEAESIRFVNHLAVKCYIEYLNHESQGGFHYKAA